MTETAVSAPGVAPGPVPVKAVRGRALRGVVRRIFRTEFTALYVWVILIGWFSLRIPDTFLSTTTMRIIMSDSAVTGILALGALIAFSTGSVDLSFGAMAGFSMVLVARLGERYEVNTVLICVLTFAVCVLLGGVTAVVVVRYKVPSMIATLGMASVLLGLAKAITSGATISGGSSETFRAFGRGTFFGLPRSFCYLIGVGAAVWYVLEMLPTGRRMFATGANTEAARLAGVRTGRIQVGGILGSAALASFAGIVLAAKVGLASDSVGPPFLLPAVAAVFLGSTQIKSRINVLGTLIAVYVLATGIKGLQLSGAESWVEDFFNGAALLVAVTLAFRRQRPRSQVKRTQP